MLQLKNIKKNYFVGDITVPALNGVSISFRKNEFVSILGPSGCGKTTLLNIVGGLDQYTDGDMIINGTSTKNYKAKNWDSYRNHSVGFVFQSYNLIPHQTVLKNVELALTLSGIKRDERRERAKKALEKVGLGDQLSKKPNQMSGGQMQRVAIARAIVNDPDIILADEPTGALDTETSVQVMEILKELAKTKLVIMVTHNPDLAYSYSTRIINLKDGNVINDSMPFECPDEEPENLKGKQKKPSMSFWTALSLSLNNLFTKKARTILTSFAGSIGIIGIALILSLSAGFNTYIENVQRDTLSNYPITINQTGVDLTGVMSAFSGTNERTGEKFPTDQKVTSNNTIAEMLNSLGDNMVKNDISTFKTHLENNIDKKLISGIKYIYDLNTSIYGHVDGNSEKAIKRLSPVSLPDSSIAGPLSDYYQNFASIMNNQSVFSEMIDNKKLIEEQYDYLDGSFPNEPNEALLVVDNYNQIDDMTLYMLGFMNEADIAYIFAEFSLKMSQASQETIDATLKTMGLERSDAYKNGITFEQLRNLEYSIVLPAETFKEKEGQPSLYTAKDNETIITELNANTIGEKLRISGIVRLKEGISTGVLTGNVCYTNALTKKLIAKNDNYSILEAHINAETKAEILGLPANKYLTVIDYVTVDPHTQLPVTYAAGTEIDSATYDEITKKLGVVKEDSPNSILIYPTSFENKDYITDFINDYNNSTEDDHRIKYTDYIGILLQSVTTIINGITYVLIAFVSISLVVSSIMIGIITYISVLERTKEIGILRSIGASKRDVKRVFNAETIIIGFVSGVMGILITLILNVPINLIIASRTTLTNIASLPVVGAFVLIAISVILTTIAGLLPASLASKKDPVVALRTE